MAKQNGGKYNFIIENKMALPIDENLFYDLMADARSWGTIQFNQDWLGQMWNNIDILKTDVTVGKFHNIVSKFYATGDLPDLFGFRFYDIQT